MSNASDGASRGVAGHVFIVNGDLTKIWCNAWLLPTDASFNISMLWHSTIPGEVDENGRARHLKWEGRTVMLWEAATPAPPAPRIWLGNVGRADPPERWFGDALDSFVREAAREIRARHAWKGRPRLAMNLVGSGDGGLFRNKGALVAELLEAAYRAVDEHDVDLVLVAWGDQQYCALQRGRKALVEKPTSGVAVRWDFGDASQRLDEAARRLSDKALSRELVLFVGAGASAGVGMPTWQKLLDELGEQQKLNPADLQRFDVRDQATLIKARFADAAEFSEALKKHLGKAHYSVVHGLLASLPVKEAVTTNFDTLLEDAMRTADRPLAVLPHDPVKANGRWLLKLHGSLDAEHGVTLSRADYMEDATRHGALFGLVQAMLLTRHMLFVGYSLSDDDFHQLVHEVQQARGGNSEVFGTTLALFDQPLAAELWDGKVDVVPMIDIVPDPNRVVEAAARLEVFLDKVAYLAADSRSFLLDDTYAAMLSTDELQVKAALQPLHHLVDSTDLVLSKRMREILKEFGA